MTPNTYKELMNQVGNDAILQKKVTDWITKIESKEVTVLTRSDKSVSSYVNGVIRISCRDDASKGVQVLWDLLHEYGHHLDPDESDKNRTIREIRAWEIAKSNLIDDDLNIIAFENHMNKLLYSYRYSDLLVWKNIECKVIFKDGSSQKGKLKSLSSDGKISLIQEGIIKEFDVNEMIDVQPPQRDSTFFRGS